jgi:hypothetical protein
VQVLAARGSTSARTHLRAELYVELELVGRSGGPGNAPDEWSLSQEPRASFLGDFLIAQKVLREGARYERWRGGFLFRFASAEVGGRLRPSGGARLPPSGLAAVEIELDAPAVAEVGTRFAADELYRYEESHREGLYHNEVRGRIGCGVVTAVK